MPLNQSPKKSKFRKSLKGKRTNSEDISDQLKLYLGQISKDQYSKKKTSVYIIQTLDENKIQNLQSKRNKLVERKRKHANRSEFQRNCILSAFMY